MDKDPDAGLFVVKAVNQFGFLQAFRYASLIFMPGLKRIDQPRSVTSPSVTTIDIHNLYRRAHRPKCCLCITNKSIAK
jgi:hypothetical protein